MLRHVTRLLLATLAAVTIGAAGATAAVATTPPTTPAPPATDAPAATAPTTTPTDDDGSDTDWVPIALVVIGALALIAILALALGRRKPTTRTQSRTGSVQSNLLSTSQWIHDRLVPELAAADPASAKQRWATERSRLDNVAIGAQQQWAEGAGDGWQSLAQTMSALAASIDTNIGHRSQTPPDPTLVAQSNEVVERHRAALLQLISALRPTVQH